jgi:hypothetical protein
MRSIYKETELYLLNETHTTDKMIELDLTICIDNINLKNKGLHKRIKQNVAFSNYY